MKTKILIPYASYGNGHKAIAMYIKNYFESQSNNYEILLVDLLSYSVPVIGSISQKLTNTLMLKHPLIWSGLYSFFDHKISGSFSNTVTTAMFKNKKLRKVFLDFNPDLTISTHFYGSNLTAYYKKKGITNTKLITVVTDHDSHELWLRNTKAEDAIVVGDKDEASVIAKRGIDKDKIKAYGIPIAPIVPTDFNKEKSLEKYGFSGERLVCLFFAGGGDGNKASLPYVKKILKSNLDIDFLFISGNDKMLKNKVEKMVEEAKVDNIRVFGFVTNVPELFEICDFVITKPGGAQSTEALYFKRPAIIINSNGGQEKANSRYFIKNGYGKKFSMPYTFIRYLKQISKNPQVLNNMTENIKRNKDDNAMEKLYDLAKEVLEK